MIMNKKTGIVLSSCIIFSLIYFSGCQKQKTAWQGTIEEVDGITIVKNPIEPLYTADVLVLEEELAITDDAGGDECIFSIISEIEADDTGRMYILEEQLACVYVFDSDGHYINTIGKQGRGPGELNMTFGLNITSRGELAVENLMRGINFYSLNGDFIRELRTTEARASLIKIDSKNSILAIVTIWEKSNPRNEVIKFDQDLNKLHSLGSSSRLTASSKGINPFGGPIMYALRSDDHVICGSPNNYEFTIYDPQGNIVMKIIKDYDPVAITKAEKEFAKKLIAPEGYQISIPKHHEPYRWFITDDRGRIFVCTFESAGEEEGFYYDVFGADGKCLVKIPLKSTPYLIKNNKLYTVETDEEGFYVVKRYHVDWRI